MKQFLAMVNNNHDYFSIVKFSGSSLPTVLTMVCHCQLPRCLHSQHFAGVGQGSEHDFF